MSGEVSRTAREYVSGEVSLKLREADTETAQATTAQMVDLSSKLCTVQIMTNQVASEVLLY